MGKVVLEKPLHITGVAEFSGVEFGLTPEAQKKFDVEWREAVVAHSREILAEREAEEVALAETQ